MPLAETKEKTTMNEELKAALTSQGERVRNAVRRAELTKSALESFDAQSRVAIKADGLKRTEADVNAAVITAPTREKALLPAIDSKADLEGVKTDTQCLLAHVSLVCAETAAMSRISQ